MGSEPYPVSDTRSGAVVVAQWAEQLLPSPKVCGSNPVISKILH